MVFSETRVNTDKDPLERPPTKGTPSTGPGPTSGQLAFFLQPNFENFRHAAFDGFTCFEMS